VPEESGQPEKSEETTASTPPPSVTPPPSAELSDPEFMMTEVGDELDELPAE